MRPWTLLISLLLIASPAAAREQPLWEAGLGVSTVAFPAYRGADHYYGYVLPLPYLIYRGEHLRVDREGLRGVLFDTERATLDLSLNAAVPVRSDDIPEREGMPNLDPTFEVGPSLDLSPTDGGSRAAWKLKLPVRAVFSVGDGVDHVGWLFHPKLSYFAEAGRGWNVGFNIGPIFADRGYHDYYYGVTPAQVTATRAAYEGEAGYSGTAVLASLSRRYDNFWIGAFIRYDNLSGASFEDSPLVVSEHALMGGLGIAWIFARSSRLVWEGK